MSLPSNAKSKYLLERNPPPEPGGGRMMMGGLAMIKSPLPGFIIRFAEPGDTGLILKFIKELATYEKLLHEVTATEEILHDSLFRRRAAEVVIGEYQGLLDFFGTARHLS